MKLLSLPSDTNIPFMRWRVPAVGISLLLCVASIALFLIFGMNYGIDFRGGSVVELRFEEPVDIGALRSDIGDLNLGEVQIVEFGQPTDVMIRVAEQPGGEEAQQRVVILLREMFGAEAEFRRVEVVGPRVSGELARAGAIAVVAALLAIMAYIWLRFEWHFAVGAVLTTLHDVILTIGLYSATQIDFNLTSIAAVLTIVGYSLNDTVVVYDRVRENLRRFKRMSMPELLNLSINQMLSRTSDDVDHHGAGAGRAVHLRRRGHPLVHVRDDLGRRGRHVLVDLHRRAAPHHAEPAAEPHQQRRRRRHGRGDRTGAGGLLMAGLVIREAHFPGRAPIDAYGNGGFRFADMSHKGSILCVPSGIYGWDPVGVDDITPDAVARVIAEKGEIDVLLVGVGTMPVPLMDETAAALRKAGVRFDTMNTGAAVRTYNVMIAEERRVAAGFIVV